MDWRIVAIIAMSRFIEVICSEIAISDWEIENIGFFLFVEFCTGITRLDLAVARASVAVREVSVVAFLAGLPEREAIAAGCLTFAIGTTEDGFDRSYRGTAITGR